MIWRIDDMYHDITLTPKKNGKLQDSNENLKPNELKIDFHILIAHSHNDGNI